MLRKSQLYYEDRAKKMADHLVALLSVKNKFVYTLLSTQLNFLENLRLPKIYLACYWDIFRTENNFL